MSTSPTLLYGYHPVHEALCARRRSVQTIFLAAGKGAPRRQQIADLAEQAGVAVNWIKASKITAMVGHPNHQDTAAKVSPYPQSSLEEILTVATSAATPPWVLLLDRVVDPQNLGAIVRTAYCAGVHGVFLPKDNSAPPSAAASKASAGALEHMRVAYVTNLVNTIKELKQEGFWIAGAHQEGAQSLFKSDLTGAMALVIGSEEKGLRPLVQKQCDFSIAIPQTGPVTSLNASAAAAVIIYETFRQRLIAQASNDTKAPGDSRL